MSSLLISAIPPQAHVDKKWPLHIYSCSSTGQRVAYGCTNGVVVRTLPDQVTFQFKPVETFLGSRKPVTCAAVSPDNRAVVAGDNDGNCYVWLKARGGMRFSSYKLDKMQYVRLSDIAISPDNKRIVVVGIDRYSKKLASAILLDSGLPIGMIGGHTRGITSCHFRPRKPFPVVTGGVDGSICVHEGPPYKLAHAIPDAHRGGVNCVRYAYHGETLASCGVDGAVRLWNVDTYESEGVCQLEHSPNIVGLSWNVSGRNIAIASGDNKIRILDCETMGILQAVDSGPAPEDIPKGLTWTMQGWIVVPCAGGHLRGWKLPQIKTGPRDAEGFEEHEGETEKLEQELEEYVERPDDDDESPQHGDDEGEPALPDESAVSQFGLVLKEKSDFVQYGPRGMPTCADFNIESGSLVVGTSLGFVMFLSTSQTVPSAFQVSRLETDNTVKSCIMGPTVACASTSDGVLRFYRVITTNTTTGTIQDRVRQQLESYAGHSTSTFQPSTRQEMVLAATSQVETAPLRLLFLEAYKYVGVLCVNGFMCVYSVEKALAHGGATENFKPEWSVTLLGKPTAVDATPDGSLMAVAIWPCAEYPAYKIGDDEEEKPVDTTKPLVELYEIESAAYLDGLRFICVFDHYEAEITALTLNGEGSLLAAVDSNRKITVLETETKDKLITTQWSYHRTKVQHLGWSPDGTKLASASTNEIYVWDTDNVANPIFIKDAHVGSVQFVRFLFNNIILSAGSDGIMKTFEIEYDEPES